VIGDTLFQITENVVKKTNIHTGITESSELSLYYMDPCDDCGGGGSGGSVSDEIFESDTEEVWFMPVEDAKGKEWYYKLFYGNEAWTTWLGIRRSSVWTRILFSEDQTNWDYIDEDLFPNASTHATMKINANIKIWNFNCPEYYRSTSGHFDATRTKARCKETGVVSWHNATLDGSNMLLDENFVN
jgi:hypothetical protein